MAFREVGVHEIREVLRLWVRGEGLRSIERLSGLDRKTVRRYVAAAQSCGVVREGGEGQLGDGLLSRVAEAVRPHRADGHGQAWAVLEAARHSNSAQSAMTPAAAAQRSLMAHGRGRANETGGVASARCQDRRLSAD
jgi:hypothetical protein